MSSRKSPQTFHYPLCPSLYSDSPWYVITDEGVTWRGYWLDADPDTFVALSDCWGIDAESVYVQASRKRRIDRASFRLLNPLYAVDDQSVYDWSGPVKGADSKTFEVLDAGVFSDDESLLPCLEYRGYARDAASVYFHDQLEGRATAIKSADVATFHSFGNGYGADRSSVFVGKSKVPKSDPRSWLALRQGYSMDSRRVWFLNREIKPVNRETFHVMNVAGAGLAYDGESYFHFDVKIKESEFKRQMKSSISGLTKQMGAVKDIGTA